MNITAIGINHKTASVEIREKLAFSDDAACVFLDHIKNTAFSPEAIILSTCNRVELYCLSERDIPEQELAKIFSGFHGLDDQVLKDKLYFFHSSHAVEHLFRVASGLDSMVLGEKEILGQVKRAYALAQERGSTGTILNNLFQKSFNVAKHLHTETGISRGSVSVSSIAVELAEKIFGNLADRQVLLVGAGEVSQLTGKCLVMRGVKGIITSNRSYDKACELAESLNGTAAEFHLLHQVMVETDIVISSTAAPNFIIKKEDILNLMERRRQRPLFIIDLAVPRDVEPEVNDIDNVYLYNVDDLEEISRKNLKQREKELEHVNAYIGQETQKFVQWLGSRDVVPTIQDLTAMLEQTRLTELEKAFARLKEKNPDQYEQIDYLTKKILKQIFHRPITKLKEAKARERFYDQVETLREMFGLNDKEEL
ncbi:MAG: glutamyl-tRNA reductase [Chlamydiota bacterium]|nr:glutamyl-tRNA reductase [Chlamydiota bacterium]